MTCVCFSFAFNLDLLRRVEKFNSIGKMWPTYNLLLGKYFLTRMPPALMDNRPCVKCFTYLKIFCFPSDFDKTWWCCSTTPISFSKKQQVLYITHLKDCPSVRSRWIGLSANTKKNCDTEQIKRYLKNRRHFSQAATQKLSNRTAFIIQKKA